MGNALKRLIHRLVGAEVYLKRLLQLSLAVGLSLVLVSGPTIQLIATAIVADGASLYSSIYGQEVVPFPSWASWLEAGFSAPYLLCALATVLACGLGSRPRTFMLWGTITSAVGLSLIDLARAGLDGFAVSLICNLFGGVIIAGTVLVATLAAGKFQAKFRRLKLGTSIGVALWPIMAGLATSFALYVVLRTLLHPTPVQVSLDAELPFNGFYSADYDLGCYSRSLNSYRPASCGANESSSEPSADNARTPQKFALLGKIKQAEKFRWIGQADPLVLEWKRLSPEPMDATLRLGQGCIQSPEELDEKATEVAGVRAIDRMQVSIPKALFEVKPISDDSLSDASVEESGLSQFSVQYADDQERHLAISRFVSKAKLTMRPKVTGGSIAIEMMPDADVREGLKSGLRVVNVVHDQAKTEIVLKEVHRIEPDAPIVCRPVELNGNAGQLQSPSADLVVDINGPKEVKYASMRNLSEMVVGNLNGWIAVNEVERSELEYFAQDGKLDVIFLNATYSKLQFEGSEVDRPKRSLVYLYGDLHASIRSSVLTVTGEAVSAHLDGQRMNMTRWEKMDGALRVALLTALPGLLILYWRRLRIFFRRGAKDVWRVAREVP